MLNTNYLILYRYYNCTYDTFWYSVPINNESCLKIKIYLLIVNSIGTYKLPAIISRHITKNISFCRKI